MRMRIISGTLKGRFITVPASKFIRPTTDRVRETLFNLLNNKIDFEGVRVLDLYAGSGSLGLECISRGAELVHFVEKNPVIYRNLTENINSLKVNDQCKIFKMEVVKFTGLVQQQYDLILADPPFFKDDIYTAVENIMKNNFLTDDSILIIERSVQTIQKDYERFGIEPFKKIGDACLYELRKNI